MGIPTLVLIRDPKEVSLSRVASHPPITLKQALKDFITCYGRLMLWRQWFVVGSFSSVTTDFGLVIRQVNRRFGTSFREFSHTRENVQQCFEMIDARYLRMGEPELKVFDRIVARPSEARREIKQKLRRDLESEQLRPLVNEARSIYEAYIAELE